MKNSNKLLTYRDLEKIIPYSRTHIHKLIKAKLFPKPLRLGENRVAFRESDILDWIESKSPNSKPAESPAKAGLDTF